MWVNNETGVIHDLEAISKIAKKHKVLLFCDATQAVGKIPIDLEKIPIDIMAFSGHKIYAPKGVGGLFLRKGLFLIPMLFGGNQQNGLRPGTANVPSIVGMGKAFEILANNFDSESKRLANLGDYFLDRATSFGGILNGSKTNRISQIINIAFEGIEANMMLEACANHFSAATGSACNSSNPEPSHVLQAMKLSKERIHESIRFSFGRFNNKTEVEKVLYAIQKAKLQLV